MFGANIDDLNNLVTLLNRKNAAKIYKINNNEDFINYGHVEFQKRDKN